MMDQNKQQKTQHVSVNNIHIHIHVDDDDDDDNGHNYRDSSGLKYIICSIWKTALRFLWETTAPYRGLNTAITYMIHLHTYFYESSFT